ncbi:MAG: WD40 repeat domain-containing protein [Candidatus Helarchaeota archaeon]
MRELRKIYKIKRFLFLTIFFIFLPLSFMNIFSLSLIQDNQIMNSNNQKLSTYLLESSTDHPPLWSYSFSDSVRDLEISKDGRFIVVSTETEVFLFDNNRTLLWTYSAGANTVVAISGNGDYIVVGCDDNKVYLFNKSSSTPMDSYTTSNDVDCVAISQNGQYIVAGSDDNNLYLFNRTSLTLLWQNNTGGDVDCVSISADGENFAASRRTSNNRIYFFDKDNSVALWVYEDTEPYPYLLSMSGDGFYLAAGNFFDHVTMFNRTDGLMWDADFSIGGSEGYNPAISNDSNYLVVGGNAGLRLFDPISSTPLWTKFSWEWLAAISGNGSYIATGFDSNIYDDKVILYNNTGDQLWSYFFGNEGPKSISISNDGDYIALLTWQNKLYLFHLTRLPQSETPDLTALIMDMLNSGSNNTMIIVVGIGIVAGIAVVILVLILERK